MSRLPEAKEALDKIIKKARVHFYKPIQIAEILHKSRTGTAAFSVGDLETYRSPSKKWRDEVTLELVGRKSTSSAKYQDNVFEANAVPPELLEILDVENKRTQGAIETYIYHSFRKKVGQVTDAFVHCKTQTKETFDLRELVQSFREEPGLKRSLDKIYEIIVYALFETLTSNMSIRVDIYFPEDKAEMVHYFSAFSSKVLGLSSTSPRTTLQGRFHRVGVTNAADKGLDIYANFGAVVQVKHISLDASAVSGIESSVSSENIIIVCREAERSMIQAVLRQFGMGGRIQAIVTEEELIDWYDKALRGDFAAKTGDLLLETLVEEFTNEFPSLMNDKLTVFLQERGYQTQHSDWMVS